MSSNIVRPVVVLFILVVILLSLSTQKPTISQDAKAYFDDLFKSCRISDSMASRTCYYRMAVAETGAHPESVKAGLLFYLQNNVKDQYFHYHDIAHQIGMVLYSHIPDPYKAFSLCTSEFSYGCYHAVIISYVEDHTAPGQYSIIKAVLFCQNVQNKIGISKRLFIECIHAVGHITIAQFHGNLEKSLDQCKLTGYKTCLDGVFMEYSKGQTQTGFHSEQSTGTIMLPCTKIPKAYKQSCYTTLGRLNPTFIQSGNAYPAGAKFCDTISEQAYKHDCFLGLTGQLLFVTFGDIYEANKTCMNLKEFHNECKDALIENKVYQKQEPSETPQICKGITKSYETTCRNGLTAYYKLVL